jgi:hypothetical protein
MEARGGGVGKVHLQKAFEGERGGAESEASGGGGGGEDGEVQTAAEAGVQIGGAADDTGVGAGKMRREGGDFD